MIEHLRDKFKDNYNYTAAFPTATVILDTASKKDAPILATMYDCVKICRGNYKTKFDYDDSYNFRNTGGIFNPLSEKEIENIIDADDSVILTARKNDDIIAMLWISHFDKTSIYFRDIIVKNKNLSGIPTLFIRTATKLAAELGYSDSFAEIYKVVYYNDGEYKKVDMLNERSFNVAISSGGRHIEDLPLKILTIDEIEFGIISNIITFEHTVVIDLLGKK